MIDLPDLIMSIEELKSETTNTDKIEALNSVLKLIEKQIS